MRIHLHGPLKGSYSLAIVNRHFAVALAKVADLTVSSDEESDLFDDEAFKTSGLASQYIELERARLAPVDVFTQNTWPIPTPMRQTGAKDAIHCFAWEETLIAPRLAKRLSDFDLVATTSISTRTALRNSGVTSKLVVCSNGTCHIAERERCIDGPVRPYRFLHVSSCFERKGALDLVQAFLDEFTAQDGVELKIKTLSNIHNQSLAENIASSVQKRPKSADIDLDFRDLDTASYMSLLDEAQCLVAPSYGEGFLFPAAEALKRGLDLIVSGWGGQLDFCGPAVAHIVHGAFEPARSHVSAPGSLWFKPDQKSLRQALRSAFEADPLQRSQALREAQDRLARDFTWDKSVERFLKGLRDDGDDEKRTSFCVVSTWEQACGIATFTEELVGAQPANVCVSSIVTESVGESQLQRSAPRVEIEVRRDWIRDNKSLASAMQAVTQTDVDSVLIEHHPALFGWNALVDAIEILSPTKVVTCELHGLEGVEALQHQAHRLNCRTRFIVHNAGDYQALCRFVDQSQVSYILHGIGGSVYRPKKIEANAASKTMSIGAFGIAAPHKGFDLVLKAAAILHAFGEDVVVRLITYCKHSDPVSRHYCKYLVELSESLRIRANTSFEFDFVRLEDVLQGLSRMDFVIYPYEEVEEGASGAVRVGLRSGACILVSAASIFDDIRPFVTTVQSGEALDYAREILRLHRSKDLRAKARASQNELLELAAWSRVSKAVFGA